MAVQSLATSLLLPPLLLVLASLLACILLARKPRLALWLIGPAAVAQLLLATPFVAGWLRTSLERASPATALPLSEATPQAVIVLSADGAWRSGRYDPGPLTLERMLAAVRLARRTGLPLLVTGGTLGPDLPPVAAAMAETLATDFLLPVRWVEPSARDTAENARRSVALLRAEGITTAYLVTHAWHLPRSLEAFARTGFGIVSAPVGPQRQPDGRLSDWSPRPDHLAASWFMLREWAGILVYRLRDGSVPPRLSRQ